MKPIKNPIGRRIKDERERREISQSKLADSVGLTQKALSQIETGKVNPRRLTIEAIETALELAPGTLYEPNSNFKPSRAQLLQLINEDRDQIPFGPLALILERFAREAPEVRAATLAVLYGDRSISDLSVSTDKADSQ